MCVLVTFELIKKIRAVALATILTLERMNQTPQEAAQRRGLIVFKGDPLKMHPRVLATQKLYCFFYLIKVI